MTPLETLLACSTGLVCVSARMCSVQEPRRFPPRIGVRKRAVPRVRVDEPEVRAKTHDRGYGRAWQILRLSILAGEPLCRMCEARGKIEPAKMVDHIHPLVDGGTHAVENLQPLCGWCHARKTARDISDRRRLQ